MTRKTKEGNVIKPFAITPEQWTAIQRAAFKRALDRGYERPNASAILREILDAWMRKQHEGKGR
jgi:hypothetical protein